MNPTRKLEKETPNNGSDILGRVLAELVQNAVETKISNLVEQASRPKLLYNLKEASEILGVPESWLAARARAGGVKATRMGLYVNFTIPDLEEFVEKMRMDSAPIKRKRKHKKELTTESD